MTITFVAPAVRGRHRLGRPGLFPVATFVQVVHRGLFVSWFRPGRHRNTYVAPRPPTAVSTPVPAL